MHKEAAQSKETKPKPIRTRNNKKKNENYTTRVGKITTKLESKLRLGQIFELLAFSNISDATKRLICIEFRIQEISPVNKIVYVKKV